MAKLLLGVLLAIGAFIFAIFMFELFRNFIEFGFCMSDEINHLLLLLNIAKRGQK